MKRSAVGIVGIKTLLCATFFVCGLAAAQQVTISTDSKLQASPSASAAVIGELKQGATAEVIGKQGAYVQVKSAAGTGWIFSFNVRYGSGGPAAASPGPQRGKATATIGIRGLDDEEALKGAKVDGKQLDALDSFATGAGAQEAEPAKAPKKAREKKAAP